MTPDPERDLLIVGGGVAGLTAGIFTARAGLDTLLVDGGESILRRNAHLENVPGFPAGVDARLFLDMTRAQAERAGCSFHDGRVVEIGRRRDESTDGFVAFLEDDDALDARYVIAASWPDSDYLDGLDVGLDRRGTKRYVEVDGNGWTGVPGLYAAGRIAKRYHQTVVAAGHGAEVALSVIHDADVPFYNDWVVPTGYFTERRGTVPPGVEEIDDDERERRTEESRAVMREWFATPHPDEPTPHPSLRDERSE